MSRLLLVLASALLAALLTAAPAAAKGPSEASVEGPGLAAPVDLDGDEGSGPLGEVTEAAGFFPAVFLSITVLAVNLLGDGLRDALDPRMAKRI